MAVDPEKLRELACTLSEDQRRLLREGLAGGENLDPDELGAVFDSLENKEIFRVLAAEAPDGGAPDGGVPDGGTGDGGTAPPTTVEPPLTRW
jgi:hypothetical protein